MREANVIINGVLAGILAELEYNRHYRFRYDPDYHGPPVSLTMPVANNNYEFDQFPPFFEGLLPEGIMLDALLRQAKLDRNDYFGQLVQVGHDVVGAVIIEEIK